MLYAKGANVTSDKGIIDFLNQYEEAVKVDPRSPQEMIDEAVQTAKQSDVVVAVVGEAQGDGARGLQPYRYYYSAKPT